MSRLTVPRTRLGDPLKKYFRGGDGRRFSYSPSDSSIQKWLVDGALRVKCEIQIAMELTSCKLSFLELRSRSPVPCTCKCQMSRAPMFLFYAARPVRVSTSGVDTFKQDIVRYCERDETRDVSIVCGKEVYKASRFMLAARSEVTSRTDTGWSPSRVASPAAAVASLGSDQMLEADS